MSARCVSIREQPSAGAAHDTHRHVPFQGTFTQPSVAAQQRPWVTGHPIHWRILSGLLNRPHSTCLTDSTDHPFQQSLQDWRHSGPRNPGLGEVCPSGKWRCTPWGQTDLVCLSTEPPTQSHRRPGQPTSATGARSPSPTKRRAVNGTRVTVGEGRGEGEEIAPWGQSDLVCPAAGPPTKIQSSNGSKTRVTGARTSVSARCVRIREQPSVGAAHDTHRHVPCQGTFTQPSVAAQQRPWITGHPIKLTRRAASINWPIFTRPSLAGFGCQLTLTPASAGWWKRPHIPQLSPAHTPSTAHNPCRGFLP